MGTSNSSAGGANGSPSAPRSEPSRPERACAVVLVGFMGAGKSTIGPQLATRLGWRFLDLDVEIEKRAGASIATIFAEHGEAGFRRLEVEATAALRPLRDTVLAAGGGWFLDPLAVARLGACITTVWLRVGVDEAVRRLTADRTVRPLLAGGDPRAAAERLLREREPHYSRADYTVDVDGRTAAQIAEHVASLIVGG